MTQKQYLVIFISLLAIVIISSITIAVFYLKKSGLDVLTSVGQPKEQDIPLTAEAYLPESFADAEESYFRADELLVKVKKAVKDKIKEGNPKKTGLASLDALNQKYKAKKFDQVAGPSKNSNKDADIFQWYKIIFSGPNEIVSAQQNLQDKKLISRYSQVDNLQAIIDDFLKDPNIEAVEPDYFLGIAAVPNDPEYASDLWGMHKIATDQAWDITVGSQDVVVTVIDTGLDRNHEDLAGNALVNQGEIPNNGIDDDSNGFIDDYYGWDFYNKDNDPMDDHSHGTHCAGTIGAVGNNGVGVVGVNWSVKIMPLKAFNQYGSGSIIAAISSIQYATMMRQNGMPIAVISASWGSASYSQAMKDAIFDANEAGILFVAAAGNYRRNNDVTPFYPASYDVPNVISVAASDSSDNLASFSCYGPTSVDLAAPGVSIQSTILGNGYSYWNGTSMATPHVAGTAALMRAAFPELPHLDIKNNILDRVDEIAGFTGKLLTGGRLNAYKALSGITPGPPDNQPPSIPQNLTATAVGPNQVNLSWNASTDNVSVAGYNIYRDGSYLNSIGGTSYTDNTVSSATTYQYYVEAFDAAANLSNSSNTVTVTTPSGSEIDTTPPEASIASPQDGETVFGTINVQALATDNVAVAKVELYLDSALFGTDNTYPYSFTWDTTQVNNGSHSLQAKAYDTSENSSLSSIITVNVNNTADILPPTITFLELQDGDTLPQKGTVSIQVRAADPSGISEIKIYINSSFVKRCWGTTDCTYRWKITKTPKGSYTLEARAADTQGNTGTASIQVIKN